MISNLPFSSASGASAGISRPGFRISSDGATLPMELLRSCVSISVSLNVNQAGSFALEINDPQLRWINTTDGLLQEGRHIEISMGYGLELQPVFSGYIVSIGADLDENGGLIIHVQGFDALHQASRESDYENFPDSESDSEIVNKIARNILGVANTSVLLQGSRNRLRFKSNVSAMHFLSELAKEYGCDFWVENDTFFFRPEREGAQPIHLRRRVNLIAFSVRLSTAGQVEEVEARAWDTSQKTQISTTAKSSVLFPKMSNLSAVGKDRISHAYSGSTKRVIFAQNDGTTMEETQRFAESELRRLWKNLVTGDGSTIGNPTIRVGSILSIDDLGRFSGEYVVESARHELNQGGYRTSFQVRQHL